MATAIDVAGAAATACTPALCSHQNVLNPDCSQQAELWDAMAEELVALVAGFLDPNNSRPLSRQDYNGEYATSSVGAAHWCQLSRSMASSAPWSTSLLQRNRQKHHETARCCRVLDYNESEEDWPLVVLKLRSSKTAPDSTLLSHATPIARQVLRQAYWSVAREVHPDRVECSLATQAMTVLNEAYRLAQLHFSERLADEVIRLDALGHHWE